MPKMKIPRKSTAIDMTAMCDVAFLLLSFFIFTAKMKKSAEVEIVTPNSVSSDTIGVKDKFNIYVNVSKEGKVLIGLDSDSMMKILAKEVNVAKNLGMDSLQIEAFSKRTSIGMDFNQIKPFFTAALAGSTDLQKGIPLPKKATDTSDNQLRDWIKYTADNMFFAAKKANANIVDPLPYIYINADEKAPFKIVDKVLNTFAKMNKDKFKLVTTPSDAPVGTAYYDQLRNPKKETSAPAEGTK
jgi:biopolymer transport protein ExbD